MPATRPTVYGPDFIALQWRDLDAARSFYHDLLQLPYARQSPPDAVLFDTRPVPFAVRTPLVDLEAAAVPGHGVSLWLRVEDSAALHRRLVEAGVTVLGEPQQGPFGKAFAFKDPAGYLLTAHDGG